MKNNNNNWALDPNGEEYAVEFQKQTVESVFDLFNGTVDAIEAETAYGEGVPSSEHRPIRFGAMRTLQLVSDYDEFVNSPNFNLEIVEVRKLDMENFWNAIGRKNKFAIGNKGVTYGNSTIYQIKANQATIGFLLNNMSFDGQTAFCLTSKAAKTTVLKLFGSTNKYPKCFDAVSGRLTRFGRIDKAVRELGETALTAWSVLEDKDSMFFYGEMKKHNWLSAKDKQLLKSIHKMGRVASFDCMIEAVELRISQLRDLIEEYEENKDTETSVFEYFDALEELPQLERDLIAFGEEHNSDEVKTTLEDYKW